MIPQNFSPLVPCLPLLQGVGAGLSFLPSLLFLIKKTKTKATTLLCLFPKYIKKKKSFLFSFISSGHQSEACSLTALLLMVFSKRFKCSLFFQWIELLGKTQSSVPMTLNQPVHRQVWKLSEKSHLRWGVSFSWVASHDGVLSSGNATTWMMLKKKKSKKQKTLQTMSTLY